MTTTALISNEYAAIFETLKNKIHDAQKRAMTAVNLELLKVYRDIGKTIYEQQQTAA